MAVHACAPHAEPRYVERQEAADPGGFFSELLRTIAPAARQDAENWDVKFAARVYRHVDNMTAIPMEEIETYARKVGALKMPSKAEVKRQMQEYGEVTLVSGNMTPEAMSEFNAALKIHVEGISGGARQLAENFLRAVEVNGESAVVQGLQFAQQMKTLSRLGAHILGWDQQLGRGLRGQRVAVQGMAKAGATDVFTETAADAFGDPGQFADQFQKIAALLQNPAQKKEGLTELISMAKKVKFAEDPANIAKGALGMEVAGDAWNDVWINGLLSSPATAATNLIGTLWVPARTMMQLGAAKAWAASGVAGSDSAVVVAAEASASLAAMQSNFLDAIRLGWHAFKTETSLYQKTSKGIQQGTINRLLTDRLERDPLSDDMGKLVDRIGEFVRLPSRVMLGTDEFAKHLAIRGEVAARGIRKAAREGVDLTNEKALQDYIRKEMESAFSLHGPALMNRTEQDLHVFTAGVKRYDLAQRAAGAAKGVADVAAEATFQEESELARAVSGALNKFPLLRPFVPFVRTPANIIRQGFYEGTGIAAMVKAGSIAMHHPTTAVLEIQKELLKDPTETARIAGQIAMTTALGGAIYGMAMNGQMTGGGPGRWTTGRQGKAAQDAWIAAGNVPYSLKMGNATVSFDRFGEPMAIVMRMFADFGMVTAYMSQQQQEEVFAAQVGVLASGLYQASFLQGLDGLMEVMRGNDVDYVLGRAAQDYVATQTPFGSLLAFVDRTVDPYKAAYQGSTFTDVMRVHEDAFGTGIFGKLVNRLPGVGSTPQLIDQITGRPVPVVPGVGPGGLNPLQMAIPVFPRGGKVDEVWQAVWDIQGSYMEKRPTGLKLSAAEQQQLNTLMASSTVGGQTLAQRVMAFRRRADVNEYVARKGSALSGVKSQIEKEFSAMLSEHYAQAFMQLTESSPEIQLRARVLDARNRAADENNVEQVKQFGDQLDDLYQRARRGY